MNANILLKGEYVARIKIPVTPKGGNRCSTAPVAKWRRTYRSNPVLEIINICFFMQQTILPYHTCLQLIFNFVERYDVDFNI